MRNKIFTVASLLIIASMVLAACAQPQTITETIVQTVEVEVVKTVEIQQEGQTVIVTATPEPVKAVEFKSKDPTTFVSVTFGDSETLDPALAYETSGGEIIMNIYDTLVYFNREDPNSFIPQLAVELPTVDNGGLLEDGKVVVFKIREGVKFHDGSIMMPSDVAFTFQRGMLMGGYSGPQWLLTEPLLGIGVHDIAETIGDGAGAGDKEALLAQDAAALVAACETVKGKIVADNDAMTVTFYLEQAWAPFLATLAQTWGSVQSEAWLKANGAWDGDCTTWQNWYDMTSEELNATPLGSSAMGTGPYKLERWIPGEETVLVANEDYWRTEAGFEGQPTGAPSIKTVIRKSVTEFSTRYSMLQAGDADFASAGSTADWPQMDLLVGQICNLEDNDCEPTDNPNGPLEMLSGWTSGSRTDVFMNFAVNTAGGNNYIGSGQLDGNGIPADFFADVHIRKAFAYCFNYDAYLDDVLLGEGTRSLAVMLPGQAGYADDTPYYSYDPDKCAEEFELAELRSADGKTINEVGFRLTLAYNTGNTARQTIGQILQAELSAINPLFTVEVTGLPWPTYLREFRAMKLPISTSGWVQDIDDPHNWVQPYAIGTFANRQNLPDEIRAPMAALIDEGVLETDTAKRHEIYKQFNQLYYDNIPTILLFIANPRRYQQRWVSGYFANRGSFGDYWYYMSKE